MQITRTVVAFVASLLIMAGSPARAGDPCPDGLAPFTEINVYFGRDRDDGNVVNEEEWQAFLADVVTPRFPAGLTMFDAHGQWLDTSAGRLHRQSTKVLNVLVPRGAVETSMRSVKEIAHAYKEHFDQQAVFHSVLPMACAGLL